MEEHAMTYTERGGESEEKGTGYRERMHTTGDKLLETVKKIVREGNARRIVIKNEEDKTILEFPLTAGVVGAALLPMWAAIGAVAALVGNCSIEVERKEAPAEGAAEEATEV